MNASVELRWDPAREESELREYLGAGYDHERLRRHREQLSAEFREHADEQMFYRRSEGYLYDLTAFAMSAVKLPYLRMLTDHLPPGARVLDYGCGIGADGLMLLEAGYRVEFADFENPSTEYLRWRLNHRGLHAPVHDLDGVVPDGFDAAYAYDVIEHVPDPFVLLDAIERRASLVQVNFLAAEPDDQPLHHALPVTRLLRHAARHRVCRYQLLHGRSHLVLYESVPAPAPVQLLNTARIAADRLARGRGAMREGFRRSPGRG